VGTNPNGPTKNVAGRIGHPISCGGITVHSGDLVLADADGVVIVERERVAGLMPEAHKKVADEAKRIAQIKAGNTRTTWLDGALFAAGVLKVGETL
jgi:regulator of RNase E activity RraA